MAEIGAISVHPVSYLEHKRSFINVFKTEEKDSSAEWCPGGRHEVSGRHQKCSINALRHGCMAETLVLTNESKEKFDQLMEDYVDRFQPRDNVEMGLVTEMVTALDLEQDRLDPSPPASASPSTRSLRTTAWTCSCATKPATAACTTAP
jgi:hypothetical protein